MLPPWSPPWQHQLSNLDCSPLSLATPSSSWSIMRGLIYHSFVRATLPMRLTQRPIGHQRSFFFELWAVANFGISNTSFKLAVTASGRMVGNSRRPWAHMQRSVIITAVVQLTIVNINTLMWFTWILHSAIASPWAVSGMLSSWLIVQHGTTRLLVLRISCRTPSLPPSSCILLQLVPLLNAFIVTVISSSLALPSASTSLTTTPKLLQHQPNSNCTTVW